MNRVNLLVANTNTFYIFTITQFTGFSYALTGTAPSGSTSLSSYLNYINIGPWFTYPACDPHCLNSGNLIVGNVYKKTSDSFCYVTVLANTPKASLDTPDLKVTKLASCPTSCSAGMGF